MYYNSPEPGGVHRDCTCIGDGKSVMDFVRLALLYSSNVREKEVVITQDERRNTLKLFNVSEAARELDICVQKMHRWLRAEVLPGPTIRLGKRQYYHADDLTILAERCAAIENHP